jgi:hypothetical protein
VESFHKYVLAVKEYYEKSSDRPRVRGLMVAQGYTKKADAVRKSFESIGDPKLEFKTWDRVIDDTERLHTGWLAVSKERVESGEAAEQAAADGEAKAEAA